MIKTADIVQEWIDEGIQQGIQQGAKEATCQGIIEILESRFDLVPVELIKSIKQIDELLVLHKLLKKTAVVESLVKFKEILEILIS